MKIKLFGDKNLGLFTKFDVIQLFCVSFYYKLSILKVSVMSTKLLNKKIRYFDYNYIILYDFCNIFIKILILHLDFYKKLLLHVSFYCFFLYTKIS